MEQDPQDTETWGRETARERYPVEGATENPFMAEVIRLQKERRVQKAKDEMTGG